MTCFNNTIFCLSPHSLPMKLPSQEINNKIYIVKIKMVKK